MVAESEPLAVGRFADIYKATLKDRTVCLKMVKVLALEDIVKVSLFGIANYQPPLINNVNSFSSLHMKPSFGDSYRIPIFFHFMGFIDFVLGFALSRLGFQMGM